MKNILIISTSLRSHSNSETLAHEFEKGANLSNNNVEFISLKDQTINYCLGCLSCQKTGKCVINDDMTAIREKMRNADIIVFATPVYYYAMSGQMKTLLDRSNPLFESDYKFRDIYLIATCADGEQEAVDKVRREFEGWIECYPKCRLVKVISGLGLNGPDEVLNSKLCKEVYELAKGL